MAHLYFKEGAQLNIHKARILHIALIPRVELELLRFVDIGVLTAVDRAEQLTTSLVVVSEANSAVRLCEDFKVSLNPWLNV